MADDRRESLRALSRRSSRRARVLGGVVITAVVVATLAGCVQTSHPRPRASQSGASASASPTPTPTAAPVFVAGGSATANKAYFDFINERLFAANGSAGDDAIVANLVSAGFEKAAMQITPDKTSVKGSVDSILFAVKIADSCLLGQHGNGGYSSAVEPALASGGCLIGKTAPIT